MKLYSLLLSEAAYAFPSAKKVSFNEFKTLVEDQEGIVLLGAGGDIKDWINGVSAHLHEQRIATSGKPSELWKDAYTLTTSGGRTDLALIFGDKNALNIGKLAMWRLQMGDVSWISDYLVNYAKQH